MMEIMVQERGGSIFATDERCVLLPRLSSSSFDGLELTSTTA